MKRTYTVPEIHRLFGMEPQRARRWCASGRWRAKKIDGEWYVCAQDVEETFDTGARRAPISEAGRAALDRAAELVA